jgi:cytidine deaminase
MTMFNPPADDIVTLIATARPLLGELRLARAGSSAATVAAAIRAQSGRVYTGVCLDLCCGLGFCAEHAAVAEMLKARETQIAAVVAVSGRGVLPPCGRCRELMAQIDPRNFDAIIGLPGGRFARLRELLPEHWIAPE